MTSGSIYAKKQGLVVTVVFLEIRFNKTWTRFASLPEGFCPSEGLNFQLYQAGGDNTNAIVRIGNQGIINGYARDLTTSYSGTVTYFATA